ncbi:MAG: hypothetical protein Q4P71_07460 [Actinomycetaceae bacterium]|nr:hypothetical protein [Actinomycetaceae bacterium]
MVEIVQRWDRVEGVIIAEHLDPKSVAEFINSTGVIAAMDWYERTPNLIGLTLVAHDRKLATVNDAGEIAASTEFEDFALDVASKFEAEVMVGDVSADALPEDADLESDIELGDSRTTVVELSTTPASSVPLLAALEDIDIALKEINTDWRALIYEMEGDDTPVLVGDYPMVLLARSNGEFKALLAVDDDPETMTMFNWGMSTRTLAGGHTGDTVARIAEELVGARTDLREIAEAIPGADVTAAENSAQLEGTRAVEAFVRALGLPSSIADVLNGRIEITDIPGIEFNDARGIANAIGRSVDKMLTEPESTGSKLWETYHKVAVERPWIVRVAASVEASIGATLIVNAIRGRKRNSTWAKAGAVLGTMMLIDSVAEVSLAKYLGLRAERHAERDANRGR